MNLVVNARDAMPDGGRLQIETHNADLGVNHAGQHTVVEPGQYVELIVGDTGHGMDAETRARIFEPFFTTKEPGRGTGLGLSMAYGVVKQSGGYIWAYSEPGKGASFKIYLPRVAGTVEANTIAQELPAPSGHETILFAEDEGSVRQLVSAFLESRGYRVLVAADGVAARQAAHSYKDKIDLLLTDVVMPKLGGRELAEDLRRTIPTLKVLFLSGYIGGPVLHASVQESGTAYVQKPFSMRFLARKIREVLDGPCASLVHDKADAAATM
jgi:CheY-like chemotaxis protein